MLFNSFNFIALFFPIVATLFFTIPGRFQWVLLLFASAYFYMAFIPYYILILFFTIIVDYIAGIAIASAYGTRRKVYLACSILANGGVLAFFKYSGFIAANVTSVSHSLGWNYGLPALSIVLPIGLSFHTFQSMSYTIEVYRGRQEPERHLGILAVYVLFFPQLVAGPIERPQNLLHQFHVYKSFDYQRVVSGLRLMAWGFFQKMVIADRLAPLVNRAYSDPGHRSGFTLLVGTVLFSFQILCDFSGYSDIALGSARVLGFKLMQNFRQPYLAQSVTEFWKRWHISLSTWFRDYLYIPLGGNRGRPLLRYRNVLLVFMVSGLWHGADWKFVIWGGLNGLFVLAEDLSDLNNHVTRNPLVVGIRTLLTFMAVTLTWIFFRASSTGDALTIIRRIASAASDGISGIHAAEICVAGVLIAVLFVVTRMREVMDLGGFVGKQPTWVRWPIYVGAVASILLLAVFVPTGFIYFQF